MSKILKPIIIIFAALVFLLTNFKVFTGFAENKINPVRNFHQVFRSPWELFQAVIHAAEKRGIISNGINKIKSDLEQQISQVQQKIESFQGQIKEKQKEQKTLKREIEILEIQIDKVNLEIEEIELNLDVLKAEIGEKTGQINILEEQISRQKEIIAQYIKNIYEYDNNSLVEIILSNENFSDFFSQLQALENIQTEIRKNLEKVLVFKQERETELQKLESQKEEELALKNLAQIQKIEVLSKQKEKERLITQNKGQQSSLAKLINEAAQDIKEIRQQLFLLEGVGVQMTLEEAYRRAQIASLKTGTRPALVLAILKKESSWGGNVGTGAWRQDMHPRDHQAFLDITKKLGLDPDRTPVSRKPSYGWGGAMGPAQFLPTTWLFYEEEVAKLTGRRPANPFNIDDAFTAAALKLSKNGAGEKTYEAEWKAAMIYFAGGNWKKPAFRFYGDSVMELAQIIQEQLDKISSD